MIIHRETSSVPLVHASYVLSWLEINTNSTRDVMGGQQFDNKDCPIPQIDVQNLNSFPFH